MVQQSSLKSRILSGVWFAVAALMTSGTLYGLPAVRHGPLTVILYLLMPTLSGGLAGFLSGYRILDFTSVVGSLRAATYGVLVAVESLLLFAPMFALTMLLTNPVSVSGAEFLGLMTMIIVGGSIAVGPILIAAGAVAGALLYRFRWLVE